MPVLTTALSLSLFFGVLIRAHQRCGSAYITWTASTSRYQHWEVCWHRSSANSRMPGQVPLLTSKVNYGVVPDVQLHTVSYLPLTLYVRADGASSYGYGVTELGT